MIIFFAMTIGYILLSRTYFAFFHWRDFFSLQALMCRQNLDLLLVKLMSLQRLRCWMVFPEMNTLFYSLSCDSALKHFHIKLVFHAARYLWQKLIRKLQIAKGFVQEKHLYLFLNFYINKKKWYMPVNKKRLLWDISIRL